MFGVMLLMKVEFKLSLLLLPIPVFYVFLFSTGLGLLLAAVTVFFRDIARVENTTVITIIIKSGFNTVQSMPSTERR